MILKTITAKNFMQYKEFSLDVSNRGLCLIQGEIEDSTFSTSNTSGKTTLVIHAPLWCFFGKNLKELKGNDVINDTVNKDCYVKSLVEDMGITYSIIRYRKHKKYKNDLRLFIGDVDPDDLPKDSKEELTKSSIAETQSYIEELFKLDWNIIVNTRIFGQGSVKRFSEFKDTERKNLLDNILNLNIIHDLQKSANAKIKEIKTELANNSLVLETCNATLLNLKVELEDFNFKNSNFENNKQNKLIKLNNEIKELEIKIKEDSDTSEINNLELLLKKINKKIRVTQKEIDSIDDVTTELYDLDGDLDNIKDKLSSQRTVLSTLELSTRVVANKKSNVDCTECGSEITEKSKAKFIKSVEHKIETGKAVFDKLTTTLHDYLLEQTKLRKVQDKVDILEVEKDKYEKYKENINFKLTTIKSNSSVETFKTILEDKKLEIENINKEENPYELLIKNKNKEKRNINIKIVLLNETNESISSKLTLYEFWNNGFSNKGIKSLLLDNIIPFLMEKTNYYLNFLTNGEIKIRFGSQSTLKSSDELRDKIDICLIKNGKDYSMGKTSGGEQRRIDICISLALQSLLSLSDSNFNITIYDEIFDSLDELGRDYVLNLLKEEIKTKDSIFVISHDSNLQDQFHNIIKIKKKNGVSYVE